MFISKCRTSACVPACMLYTNTNTNSSDIFWWTWQLQVVIDEIRNNFNSRFQTGKYGCFDRSNREINGRNSNFLSSNWPIDQLQLFLFDIDETRHKMCTSIAVVEESQAFDSIFWNDFAHYFYHSLLFPVVITVEWTTTARNRKSYVLDFDSTLHHSPLTCVAFKNNPRHLHLSFRTHLCAFFGDDFSWEENKKKKKKRRKGTEINFQSEHRDVKCASFRYALVFFNAAIKGSNKWWAVSPYLLLRISDKSIFST